MDKRKFEKEYKGVKMHKYVPLLEKEVGNQMNRVGDWREAALDTKEEFDNFKNKSRALGWLYFAFGASIVNLLVSIAMLL